MRRDLVQPRLALTICYAALYPLVVLDPPRAPFGPPWLAATMLGLAVVMCLAGLQVFRVRSRGDAPLWTRLAGYAHGVVVTWAAVSVFFLFLALIAQAPEGFAFLAMGFIVSLLAFVAAVLHFWVGGLVLFYVLPVLYVAMLLALQRGTSAPDALPG